jgi:hypothetical protein
MLAVIALLLVVALFIPREYLIRREIIIERSASEVFNYIKFLENQDHFSKWISGSGYDEESPWCSQNGRFCVYA